MVIYTPLCGLISPKKKELVIIELNFYPLAGTSYYGISNLIKLYDETHFFERGYLDLLIGSRVENRNIYESRSPINQIENITSPVLIFQGSEDPVSAYFIVTFTKHYLYRVSNPTSITLQYFSIG